MAVYSQDYGGGLSRAAFDASSPLAQAALTRARAKAFAGRPDPLQFDDGRGTWKGANDTSGYVNRAYNPTQNDNGYTRFDSSQYGAGLERAQNYAAAVPIAEKYFALKQGQAGYDHAQDAKGILKKYHGITDWTKATDKQLFEAYDSTFRGLQKDNQKVQGGTLGKIAKLAAAAAATYFTAGAAAPLFGATTAGVAATGALAGAVGATTSGVLNNNLSLKGVGTGALMGGAGGYLKAVNPWAAPVIGDAQAINALGLNSTSLYNPGSLADTASSAGSNLSTAFHPGALGLTGLNLSLGLRGANLGTAAGLPITSTAGGGFFNPNALGRTFNNYSLENPLYTPASLGGSSPTLLQRSLKTFDQLMDSGLLSGGNQAQALPGAGVVQRQQQLAAPGLGGGRRFANSLPIPTTGIREALSQQAAKRLQNNGGLTRLTPIQSGLLRL